MQYFSPIFQLATLAPPQPHLRSKIGGIPWGLPPHLWPSCCNHPQKLLAQLLHDPPFLDLGHENAVLHLFQCLECYGIGYDGRGRAAFITDRSQLTNAPTTVPGYDDEPALGNRLIGEAFITGYQTHDDQIPPSRLPEFFDEKKLWALHKEFPNIDWDNGRQMSKFTGSPRWTGNGPMGFPPPPFEFLFQLDNYLFIDGPAPSADDVGTTVRINKNISPTSDDSQYLRPRPDKIRVNAPWFVQHDPKDNGYYFDYTNLASDGTLFVFINRTTHPHTVQWFLNR